MYVCYVDFSKAFDLVNRHILFYKLIKSGWSGKVLDTMRSLYTKTFFRLKCDGMVSMPILDTLGVNQGGNASVFFFRKYLADLSDYLYKEVGVCIGQTIIAHLLWADDLILFSDTVEGLQRQLNGLYNFCSENMLIVNQVKTKVMVFGKRGEVSVTFNGAKLECVNYYKYLGNIIKGIKKCNGDVFGENYKYLCDKGRNAIFGAFKKLRPLGTLPVEIMCHMFDSLVRPILVYGSDVWGMNKSGTMAVDKVFMWYIRRVLKVKTSTCNIIAMGEVGILPPSVTCHMNVLNYYDRLVRMPDSRLAKQVFNQLSYLHDNGFETWVGRVRELALNYGIDLRQNGLNRDFKKLCLEKIHLKFNSNWFSELQDIQKNPLLRTYCLFKTKFCREPYLDIITNNKYRAALTQLRTSSHTLEIQRGRQTKPKTAIENRLCVCGEIEDECHFVINCPLYNEDRKALFSKVSAVNQNFVSLNDKEKFIFLITLKDDYILNQFAKFVYMAFQKRNG